MIKTPYIIAEIGVNYFDIAKKENITNMEAAKFMIKEAKLWWAHAAKFQSYKANKIVSKNSPAYWDTSCEPTKTQYELFQKFDSFWEEEYKELATYSQEIWIDFLSTPFDLEAVDFLDPLMKYFKIASADITNYPLLKKVATKNKPIIISTWASTIWEIEKAIKTVKEINNNIEIHILHCVLSYPTKDEYANLNRLTHLKNIFSPQNIGLWYSDHTLPSSGMAICTWAFMLWANIIEKHFTLDKTLPWNDHYHAMDTNDLWVLKNNIDILKKWLSIDEINYQECEKIPRDQARRSIVLNKNLKIWDIIKEDDIIMKRPWTGIWPEFIDFVIWKKVLKELEEDTILQFNYI